MGILSKQKLAEIPTSVIMSYIQMLDLGMNGMDQLFEQIDNESKNPETNMRESFKTEIEEGFQKRMTENQLIIGELHKELDLRIRKSLGNVTTMDYVQKVYVNFMKSKEKPVFKKIKK
jgi:hypothetical protein